MKNPPKTKPFPICTKLTPKTLKRQMTVKMAKTSIPRLLCSSTTRSRQTRTLKTRATWHAATKSQQPGMPTMPTAPISQCKMTFSLSKTQPKALRKSKRTRRIGLKEATPTPMMLRISARTCSIFPISATLPSSPRKPKRSAPSLLRRRSSRVGSLTCPASTSSSCIPGMCPLRPHGIRATLCRCRASPMPTCRSKRISSRPIPTRRSATVRRRKPRRPRLANPNSTTRRTPSELSLLLLSPRRSSLSTPKRSQRPLPLT